MNEEKLFNAYDVFRVISFYSMMYDYDQDRVINSIFNNDESAKYVIEDKLSVEVDYGTYEHFLERLNDNPDKPEMITNENNELLIKGKDVNSFADLIREFWHFIWKEI